MEYGGYIKKLIFNNSSELELNKDDIVVFVGPNNVGKSQSLKDINILCESDNKTKVITKIEVQKSDGDPIELLEKIAQKDSRQSYYSGLNFSVYNSSAANFARVKNFGLLKSVFVTHLTTEERLQICHPAPNIPRNHSRSHPIHYAQFDREHRKWLSNNFKKAFGKSLIPNESYGSIVPLCIGEEVKFNHDFPNEHERYEEYAKILETYPQVQDQGDGIKSFVGILLYLMLDYHRIFLIDEPESFLHPPQANIMGRIIGETLKNNQQAFISTHSEDLIKGIMSVSANRLKIVRITRTGDINSFSVLNNEQLKNLWSDPILKYSNIMSSLFHKTVILCESDSDCKFYSIIDSYCAGLNKQYSENLYIQSGGKHRMPLIITALKSLGVETKIIVDIDILNDEQTLKRLIESSSINWDLISKDYQILDANLHSDKENINREDFFKGINKISELTKTNLTKKEISYILEMVKTKSKWDNLKSYGISAIPAGDAKQAFDRINNTLISNNIFIVPCGEIEGFVKSIGGHGPDWVNKVIEIYPDISHEVYKEVRDFLITILH